jgi:heme-degrading monooxygenase HmoA
MIQRIVKLTFREETADVFIETVFEPSKNAIRAFAGCYSMQLLRDTKNPCLMFTYSVWDSAEALEAYRQSELFEKTWEKTKALFGGKPEAWSCALYEGS